MKPRSKETAEPLTTNDLTQCPTDAAADGSSTIAAGNTVSVGLADKMVGDNVAGYLSLM